VKKYKEERDTHSVLDLLLEGESREPQAVLNLLLTLIKENEGTFWKILYFGGGGGAFQEID